MALWYHVCTFGSIFTFYPFISQIISLLLCHKPSQGKASRLFFYLGTISTVNTGFAPLSTDGTFTV